MTNENGNNNIFSKIHEFFIWLDCLGPTPSITHKGKCRYKTLLGSLLTIFPFVFISWLYSDRINETYYGLNPSIDTFESRICCEAGFNYTDTKNMKLHFQFEFYDELSNSFKIINKNDYPNIWVNLYKNGIKQSLNNTLTINSNNLTTAKNNEISLDLNLELKQMKELQKNYQNKPIFFVIKYLTSFIFTSNTYEDEVLPLIFEIKSNRVPLDFDMFQSLNIEIQDKSIKINKNRFFLPPILKTGINMHSYKELSSIDIDKSIPLDNIKNKDFILNINFKYSPVVVKTFINYQKVESVLSDIGGLIGLVFPILEFFCCIIVLLFMIVRGLIVFLLSIKI